MKKVTLPTLTALLLVSLATAHAATWHVATNGNDKSEGCGPEPFRTIQHAAEVAQPGDVITVHAGVYRERINPPRGGESEAKRITYQAAPGELVEIKGSEVVKNWTKVDGDVWKATLPNAFFGTFNPFSDLIRGDWFNGKGREHHTGAVYLNGDWLIEAAKLDEVLGKVTSKPPAKSAHKEYIINLTWLRPGEGAEKIPFTSMTGNHELKKAPCSEGGECVGWLEPGDWVRCARVEFKQPTEQLELRASCAAAGAVIEVRRDSATGELLGSQGLANTGGWQSWVSCKVRVRPLSGAQSLCFVFNRGGSPVVPAAPLWFAQVDKDNTTIWAQFKGVNPNEQLVEVNARQTVFYPDKPGKNFITVRGFTMRHAATPWAPPTAEQPGLIGTHWSKGWIIENNIISHSICSGIALGKHGDQFDNTSANSAEGYVKTIERAHAHAIPWTKENIGHHIVRNNHISHCEQTGIVGSLGCAFSSVTGNVIHDIHIRRLFTGAEMGGIKFHGAIDTEISSNHIYRTCRGLWLDWMAQGTRVSRNLFHDNLAEDLFVEVNHGPFVVDNNLFLSPVALLDMSEGGAYVHNLITGKIISTEELRRETPFHPAHSTQVAGLATIKGGDNRYYNNLIIGAGAGVAEPPKKDDRHRRVAGYGTWVYDAREFPSYTGGNAYLNGARPYGKEEQVSGAAPTDPQVQLVEEGAHTFLQCNLTDAALKAKTALVTTKLLGRAKIPGVAYETADGSPLQIDADYFGKQRDATNPTPGPFEKPGSGALKLKVW
jgi:hypothetical protein